MVQDPRFPPLQPPYPMHECGVFGVFGHPNAAVLTYYGLFALQHRGQESAGIVTSNGPGSSFQLHRDMGLVSQVFGQDELERLKGRRAIGHTRYSTTGSSTVKNAQPFVVDCFRGQLAIAHNGNLINADVLRDELERKGSIFQTTVDSEIILHLLAQPSRNGGNILTALRRVEGAFSLIIMSEREIIAVRDPFGFRPLSLGKLDGAYILASESCAFDLIHAEFIREIEPGEVLIISENGLRSEWPFKEEKPAFCMFEYVYFARPDSIIGGINVAKVRTEMGRELARKFPVEADIVVPVPDSGNYAALGFAQELDIPYKHAFVRNHYIGRTFLQPTPAHSRLQCAGETQPDQGSGGRKTRRGGRRLDRPGNNRPRSRRQSARGGGEGSPHAGELSAAPLRLPLRDRFPRPRKADREPEDDAEQICEYLGVDSLGYLDLEGMIRATGQGSEQLLPCLLHRQVSAAG